MHYAFKKLAWTDNMVSQARHCENMSLTVDVIAGKSGDLSNWVNQSNLDSHAVADTYEVVAVIVPLLTSNSHLKFIVT